MVYLYSEVLELDPNNLQAGLNRDYLFLTKGHDVAMYGTLAELGFIEEDRLQQHPLPSGQHLLASQQSHTGWREFHSGSHWTSYPLLLQV